MVEDILSQRLEVGRRLESSCLHCLVRSWRLGEGLESSCLHCLARGWRLGEELESSCLHWQEWNLEHTPAADMFLLDVTAHGELPCELGPLSEEARTPNPGAAHPHRHFPLATLYLGTLPDPSGQSPFLFHLPAL